MSDVTLALQISRQQRRVEALENNVDQTNATGLDVERAILSTLQSLSRLRSEGAKGVLIAASAGCDEVSNAIQWLKNVRDGVCDFESAILDMQAALQRLQALASRPEAQAKCEECDGSGWQSYENPRIAGGHGRMCNHCNGTGSAASPKCEARVLAFGPRGVCVLPKGHAGDHSNSMAYWPVAPDAAAPAPTNVQFVTGMSVASPKCETCEGRRHIYVGNVIPNKVPCPDCTPQAKPAVPFKLPVRAVNSGLPTLHEMPEEKT